MSFASCYKSPMPMITLLLIFITSAFTTELNSLGEFSTSNDVTGLMPALELKPETKEVIFVDIDKQEMTLEVSMEKE